MVTIYGVWLGKKLSKSIFDKANKNDSEFSSKLWMGISVSLWCIKIKLSSVSGNKRFTALTPYFIVLLKDLEYWPHFSMLYEKIISIDPIFQCSMKEFIVLTPYLNAPWKEALFHSFKSNVFEKFTCDAIQKIFNPDEAAFCKWNAKRMPK